MPSPDERREETRGTPGGPNWPCANCSHPRRDHVLNPDAPGCTRGCNEIGCECPRYVAHKDIWSRPGEGATGARLVDASARYIHLLCEVIARRPAEGIDDARVDYESACRESLDEVALGGEGEWFCANCAHTAGKHTGTKRGGSSCDVAGCQCAALSEHPEPRTSLLDEPAAKPYPTPSDRVEHPEQSVEPGEIQSNTTTSDPVTGEREATEPIAVGRGEEHPSWSRYAYLCGQCGEVSYADDWLAFKHDDDGGLMPAEADDSDPIIRCPVCKTDHKDADDDSGVWAGTRKEMYAERETQLKDPIIADAWIDFWKARADKGIADLREDKRRREGRERR